MMKCNVFEVFDVRTLKCCKNNSTSNDERAGEEEKNMKAFLKP